MKVKLYKLWLDIAEEIYSKKLDESNKRLPGSHLTLGLLEGMEVSKHQRRKAGLYCWCLKRVRNCWCLKRVRNNHRKQEEFFMQRYYPEQLRFMKKWKKYTREWNLSSSKLKRAIETGEK